MGPHHIDLFASPTNAKIPHNFVSWNYHPTAAWINAFSRDWTTIPGRHTDHTELALSTVVANPPANDPLSPSSPTTISTIDTTSRRRRRSPSPEVEFDRMEHLNKRFRAAQLSHSAINTIQATQHSRTRNYQTYQRLFVAWCRQRTIDPNIPHAPTIISFLADTREAKNWAVSTTLNAKSAILDLYSIIEQQNIRSDSTYVIYIKALKDSKIPTRRTFDYDLTPVFDHIRSLGSNDTMSRLSLSRKTAWLLAMCGFLRPSDLHRMDLDLSEVNRSGHLVLHIVAPKDKRKGSRRIKSVTIHPHRDPVFCPVQAFISYRQRLAVDPLRAPHPIAPATTINYFFRNTHQLGSQVTSTTISRYMSDIMQHIGRAPDAPIPDPRHLGSTLAATAGLSVDDIVAHGGWASQDTFLLFYRQSSETHTDFTNSTLDQQPRSQSGLCNVM
ncbi:hypothetical protein BCR42DRAFT_385119 [Absidia repens]|uniref:Tyr recombinase domain-containing protein n=1 Tax=Absidia repens TaxID=90262 RepID=A0A1X2HXB6_9FUNG|nr:hypothetical protein BCR42DRAFT_385119 [Absidia repens]